MLSAALLPQIITAFGQELKINFHFSSSLVIITNPKKLVNIPRPVLGFFTFSQKLDYLWNFKRYQG